MTPDEKAIIDAKREGWVAATLRHCYDGVPLDSVRANIERAAAKIYPYPPPPVVWREAVDGRGDRWRVRDGKVEVGDRSGEEWVESAGWLTPDFILALARCVTEPTVGEGEVEG